MNEVKRYDISAFGGMSMDECRDGAYVNYDDYAALETKCSALASEVEAVKSARQDAVNTIMYTANRTGVLYTEKTIQMSCKTPATDAFLAEVRAQGVEMFAECAYTLEHHDHAVAFAAELRKGVNQK